MKEKKQTLKDTFNVALQNYKKNNFKEAEIICYKILNIDQNHLDSISLLATIFAVHRNFNKAKELLIKAIRIEPNNVSLNHNLGTAYKELGDFKEAMNYYKKVLQINPQHTNAHYNIGLIHYSLNDLKEAKNYFKKTVNIQNNYALAFFSLANVHAELKEYNDAVSCYQKAIEINPKIVGSHNNLGLVFRVLNDFQNAIKCYEKAIEIQPNHAGAHHNLASIFKETGQFDKAIISHQTAIKYEPNNLAHYHFLSELKKNVLDIALKSKIEKILKNDKSNKNNKAYGNYLLAKYEHKIKNYEKELNYLIKGHDNFYDSRVKKFKLGVKYCFDEVLQISEGVKVEKSSGKNNHEIKPIFIIGVPRCGSTLLEKIIGSGKNFIPLGEETAVLENYINAKILEKKSLNLGSVEEIKKELFEIYKNKGLISKKFNYVFTDKSLNNFFYLEFIKKVYPESKIINCKRDVLSSIMSIFQNNLSELAWTHNLENIFKYFDNYFKIIKNFNKKNPKLIYQIQYEELIKNPEEESKKLMKFCDLTWDQNCLKFYKRKDLISKTASNIQIREAIYKHSSNKYLPYKKFLEKYGEKYSWFN